MLALSYNLLVGGIGVHTTEQLHLVQVNHKLFDRTRHDFKHITTV